MRCRPLALGLAAALATAAGWVACSGQQAGSSAKDGGNDASGTAGTGANGGSSGAGGTGGSAALGGSGGTAGAPADAGAWGPAPVWQAIPGTAAGCTFERMVNASQIRMFKWEPCSWSAGCEQAAWNTDAWNTDQYGTKSSFVPGSVVVDDGTTVRAGLTMWGPHHMGLVVGDDGMALDAVRVKGWSLDCRIDATSVWKGRFAIYAHDKAVQHFGGIVGAVGALTTTPVTFDIPEPAPVGGPQQAVLGDTRWLWWWAPVDRLSTVSAFDGSGFQMFTKAVGSIVGYSDSATTGPLFLAQEYETLDGGHAQGKIAYSDGVSPMKPYLVPPNILDDYGYPAFANNYVGFMRGIHQKDINVYDAVEVWATPYGTDPAKLAPEKVGDYPYTSMGYLVGGWGHLGLVEATVQEGPFTPVIWNISTKTPLRYPELPVDHFPNPLLGVTHTHFWLGGRVKGVDPYLMRFKVE